MIFSNAQLNSHFISHFLELNNLDLFFVIGIILLNLGLIILLSGKKGIEKAFDIGSRGIITIAAAANLYNNFKPDNGSSSGSDNNDDKDKKKKIKKLKITKQVMNHLMKIKNKVNSLKHVFIFPWIISNLDIQISDSDSSFMHFAYSVFFLSLVSFFCLVNIVGYSITYYLIQKGNYENKYPRISKFINRYKKGTILLYIIEVVLCFICLSILIIFSFLILYSNIKS